MKAINGKAIRIHDHRILDVDFYGLEVMPNYPGSVHKEAENEGERKFQESNTTFIHWPATFYFYGQQYTPDFYDPESHTFFEIIGTSARYYQGQNKMLRTRRQIGARIVLCNPSGERFIPRFKRMGRSYPITNLITIGKIPVLEYYQDDYGKKTFSQ